MRHAVAIAATLAIAGSAEARAPAPSPDPRVHAGANHHLGDESFIAMYGRPPRPDDPEAMRMHAHLAYVRAWLGSRPATRPELAERRAQILAAFDDYIAHGKTPDNDHLPWRTPVFIDDHGTICAVGYLIQQTEGRALAETIASHHRYDLIEDIATAMPEVSNWVATSGLSLDEISRIQPAYANPEADSWRTWAKQYPDGPYDGNGGHGAFKGGEMDGLWTVADDKAHVVGRGTMHRGSGEWASFYPDGHVLGAGRYVHSRADGRWQMFFDSGNLAAEGAFDGGTRHGTWRFYYDTPARTPIAIGPFDGGGHVTGTWHHYGADGALIATSRTATPDLWGDTDPDMDGGDGHLLTITPGPDRIQHDISVGTVGGNAQRLDRYASGADQLYVHDAFGHQTTYDADGRELVRGADNVWRARDCGWNAGRKAMARAGDIVPLHGLLYADVRRRVHASRVDMAHSETGDDAGPVCGALTDVDAARGARYDALIAEHDQVRALPPAFVRDAVLGAGGEDDQADPRAADLAHVLATNMTMFIEWPHIDGAFVGLFRTMAGRFTRHWYDGDPEEVAST